MASPREIECLQLLHAWTDLTVGEAAERMNAGREPPLAYTTVQTLMNRMEAKGLLSRRRIDGVYRYAAATPEGEVRQGALTQLVKAFFGGSTGRLAAHLVEHDLSDKEIAEVEALIEASRRRRETQ